MVMFGNSKGGVRRPTRPPRRLDPTWYDRPESRLATRVGPFQLQRVLGVGGNAVTYMARDIDSAVARHVVVKLFYLRLNEDPYDKIRRFVLEAVVLEVLAGESAILSLAESSILPARDPTKISPEQAEEIRARLLDGYDYYLVLPFLSGGTLEERLARHGPLAPEQAIALAQRIGVALARAHSHEILHRDVKPPNILLNALKEPFLADWGTALFLGRNGPRLQTDVTRRPIGTSGYIPRESYRGRDTVQRDVYGLGVTFLEALTGLLPESEEEDVAFWEGRIAAAVIRVPDADLRAIVAKAVATSPSDRYPTVAAFLKALEQRSTGRATGDNAGPGATLTEPPHGVLDMLGHAAKQVARLVHPRRLLLALRSLLVVFRSWSESARQSAASQRPRAFSVLPRWSVTRAVMACALGLTVWGWMTTWPEFYGKVGSRLLPFVLAATTLWNPWLATTVSLLALALLGLSLSPLLGFSIGAVMGASLVGSRHSSPAGRTESLFHGWLLGSIITLVTSGTAVAIPIFLAIRSGSLRKGAAVGTLAYIILSLWATLKGAGFLGATMIFDPEAIGIPWFLDITLPHTASEQSLALFFHEKLLNGAHIRQLAQLMWELWTASPAPVLGLLVWSGTGALAGFLSGNGWPMAKRMSTIPWPEAVISVASFVLCQIWIIDLLGLHPVINVGELLLAGILSIGILLLLFSNRWLRTRPYTGRS